MLKNTSKSYGSISKWLHWLIAIAVITMLALGFIASNIEQQAWVSKLFWVHKSLGLTVLAAMVLRLAWRFINISPSYGPHVKPWEALAAKGLHWFFYIAIFAMLATGWITSSTGKYGVSFWGWFNATLPMAPSKSIHHFTEHWHGTLAWLIVALIVFHVLAACKHHFFDRDDVLTRMLPNCPRKKT